MHLVLSSSAERDLQRGLRFYQDQQAELGTYFLDSILADTVTVVAVLDCRRSPSWALQRIAGR